MDIVKQITSVFTLHMILFSMAVLTVNVVRAGIPSGSDVRARCFSTLLCSSEIGFMTIAECCLLPQGLSYNIPGNEQCGNCIVYGWTNADGDVRVQEAGSGQRFEVGYIKTGRGTPPQINLTVVDVEGTARRGAAFDYIVTDNTVTISSSSNEFVTVIIQEDGIALEDDETFQLRLVANPPPVGEIILCRDELNVTIQDGNGIWYLASARSLEKNYNHVVKVEVYVPNYNITITNMYTSYTVNETSNTAVVVIGFLNTSYTVGESDRVADIQIGVIEGSLQRPVAVQFSTSAISAADSNDYNGFVGLEFIFNSAIRTVNVSVPVIGDNVFELIEQFGASLAFPGAPPPRVTLAPDSAQVTILDDDVLTFGFEPLVYNVSEGVESVNLGIFFISGNTGGYVPHVNVSTVDGTATGSGGEADYTPVVEQSISFTLDSANKIQNLTVQIVPDFFTELNETFSAVLSSVFLTCTTGGAAIDLSDQERARLILNSDTATVNILDDDEAVIGFVNTDLSISEDGGELQFEIALLQGTLRINVSVNFATDDGAASAGLDYEATTTFLLFSDQSREFVFVPILDDSLFEDPENFFGRLSAAGVLSSNVRLAPPLAAATVYDDDNVVIGLDPNIYNVNEGNGTVSLTLRLLRGIINPGYNFFIRITTDDDSAQAPLDYTAISEAIIFSNSSIQTVNLSIANDDLLEINEVFTVLLALENSADAARVILQPDSATVAILDDDMVTIGFVPDAYTVVEGDDHFANLSVELISGQLGREVIVNMDTQSGSAIAGSDFFGANELRLTFSPAFSFVTVIKGILDDNILEDLVENFTATLTSAVPGLFLSPDVAAVDILDDDSVTFGFEATHYTVLENALNVTVIIHQISGGTLGRSVLINLQTRDGTAISSGEKDFEARSVELTFGPGITEQEITMIIIDDLRLEHDEQFNLFVYLTVADPAVSLSPDQASITIINDDGVVIGFSQSLYQVNEDAGQATMYVELRSGILHRPVVVNIIIADGTALNGSDYSSRELTLNFDRNNLIFSISIDIIDDQVHELSEDFLGRLSTADGDVILDPQQMRVCIADNDVVTFTFSQSVYTFMEDVRALHNGSVCIDKIGETDQTITVTMNGPTQSGSLNRMLVFAPDTESSCIDFPVVDDNVALEDPEEFIWTLQPVPIPHVEISGNTKVVITDDDSLILNLVKAQNIPEAIGSAQACITFSNPIARSFEIFPSAGRPPNSNLTISTPGIDYHAVITPIMANPGDSQACFNIMIENDVLVEEIQECLMVSFTAELLVNLKIGKNSSVCCIIDDDNVIIGFDPSMYHTVETNGYVSLAMRVLAGQLARTVSVNLFTQDGTANSTAPADISRLFITLEFSPSILVQQAVVTIIDDDVTENPEQFTCVLDSTDSAVILAPDTASMEILDNDAVTIGFVPNEYNVSENGGSITLMVGLISGVLEREVIVNFTTKPDTATSTVPADYEHAVRQLTFSPTVNVNPVPVTIIDDNIHENNETFLGTLTATGQPAILNPDTTVITIIDDNDPVTIGFHDTIYSVHENDSEVNLQIGTLNGSLQRELSFVFSFVNSEAIAGEDFINISNPVNITLRTSISPPIKITIINDKTFELTEMFSINLSLPDHEALPPGVSLNQTSAQVIILDNDEIRFDLGLTENQVNESTDLVQLNVIRSGQFNEIYSPSVEYGIATTGSSTARVNEDFQLIVTDNTRQIMFTNCDQMKELVLAINNDLAFESDENIIVTLINVTLTRMENGSNIILNLSEEERRRLIWNMTETTVTILDDDAVTIGFDSTDYRVDENVGAVAVNIRVINGTLQKEVMVSISTVDSTAISDFDYIELTDYRVILNSSTTSVIIHIIIIETNDTQLEKDEQFIVHLSFPGEPIPGVTLDPDKAMVEIIEFDGGVGFYLPEYNVSEGDGTLQITVGLLSGQLRSEIVLSLGFSTPTIDLMIPMEVTLSPSTLNNTISVVIADDTELEGTESFILVLNFTRGETHRLNLMHPTAIVTIFDDDAITIGFSRTAYTINENDGEFVLIVEVKSGTVTLKSKVLLNISTRDSSAVGGSDFMTADLQIELNESVTMASVSYSILNDGSYEQTEWFLVDLSFSGESIPGVTLSPNSTEVVIMDDDVSQLIGAVVGPLSVLLLSLTMGLIVLCIYCYRRSIIARKGKAEFVSEFPLEYTVQSSYRLNLPMHLIIPASSIEMKETIGQGEFGVVYKGQVIKNLGQTVTETVAIKTLKGFYDGTTVRDMLRECSKMSKFDHPNVLTLQGVCLDGGPAPYIIMPFMANGNLLTYLKNNRKNLVVTSKSEDDQDVYIACKRLQDMCLQVAKGMEYLAKMKVVHRDLAARNCMIDLSYIIKVGDFGLTESVGTKQYYRQNKLATVRLPVRWLAPESLEDYIFSEKSDVWAYGVTCWEIFTAGKVPYATVHLNNLLTQINNGYRLEKPANDACDDEVYTIMLQCWDLEPKIRPTFSDLVNSLSQSLEAMAGYMNVGAFGELQVAEPVESSKFGDSEKPDDHNFSEKESKADEVKLELSSVDETCTSV